MADLDPRQLDQLEDMLEDLEQLDALELAPAVAERLAEYQDVLARCRDAFPSESPREDLLLDVLAEAHAVSRRPKLRERDDSRWRRTWERWRGTLIPGLALAGTAAVVLLLLDPDRNLERGDKPEIDTTPSGAASEPSDDDEPEPNPEPAADEPEPEPSPKLGGEPPADIRPETGHKTVSKQASKPSHGKSVDATPIVAPAAKPEPLSKDATWTTLERANADRRKGDCDRARTRYEQIIDAGSDSLAVARAKAGIGLCLEQDRRTSEADPWFADARSTSPGIDAWIETQRDDQPAPGEIKKSKAMPAEADMLDSL